MRTLPLLLLLLAPTVGAADNPDDFNSLLKRVESHYGKRHMRIPFLGLVTFASHFTRPLGASGFRLAVIEGVGPNAGAFPEFEPGPGWRPFIRTTSKRGGEHVVMFGRDEGQAIHTLMVVVDDNEAVVMQMRLAPTAFLKFLAEKSRSD